MPQPSNNQPLSNSLTSSLQRSAWMLVFALFCANSATALEAEGDIAKRLVGEWQELRKVDCELHQQVMAISAAGTFNVKGVIHGCVDRKPYEWRGKWRVEGKKFRYVTTYSDPPDLYRVGEEFEDEILSVSDREWVMLERSTGNKSVAYRIR